MKLSQSQTKDFGFRYIVYGDRKIMAIHSLETRSYSQSTPVLLKRVFHQRFACNADNNQSNLP